MNNKVIAIIWLTIFLLLSNAWAIPLANNIKWDKLKGYKPKHYENKKYKTYEEYVDAVEQGKCSSMWLWMHVDKKKKIEMINTLKSMLKERSNIIVTQPAEFYIERIDDMAENDEQVKNFTFGAVFKAIAIIEYDYDEGIDKDKTAKKWLGDYYWEVKKYRGRNE